MTPATITLLYAVIGAGWFLFADHWLLKLFPSAAHTSLEWIFVALTSTLLYSLLRQRQSLAEKAASTPSESEEQLRLALEASNEGFWEWRPEQDTLHFSARNLTLLGYVEGDFEVTPGNWERLIHPEDRPLVTQTFERLRAGDTQEFRLEFRVRAKNGEYRWLIWRGKTAERTADGRAQRVLGTQADITSRRLMELELRESEERFRALLEASPDMVFLLDREERVLYVNAATSRVFGLRPEQIIGKKQSELFSAGTASRQSAAIQQLFCGGPPMRDEEERILGGQSLWIETFLVPVKGRDGEIVSALGVSRDITERRRAEADLREAYRQTAEILETISDGFFALDRRLVIRVFNKAAAQMLRRSAAEAAGRPFLEVFPELAGSAFEENLRHALATRAATAFETEIERPPLANWYDVRTFPMREGVSVFFRITTDRKRFEARLAQLQRVEAAGRLAGGIAHDFNNQLAAIMGYNELLANNLPEGHPGLQRTEHIRKAAERAALLTRQLLAFGRKQVLEPMALDLNLVVADLSDMLRRMVGEDVELSVVLASDLRRVRVDRAQLEQALINMAANARDAMPAGGRLTIETRNVSLDEEYCRQHIDAVAGSYVLLTMSDTGCGMNEMTLQHLFEPFFTTKEDGRSTGLGLSSIYGFVTQSAGHVAVESEPGRGSRFFIYLPEAIESAQTDGTPTEAPLASSSRSATILVVEDEEIVRRLIVEVLEEAGYTVLSATHGTDASQVVSEYGRPIDLLVTDVFMPQLGGRQLADRLRQTSREIGVLYVSGYPQDAIEAAGAFEPGTPFLRKPFVPTELVRRVREILRRRH